MYQYKIQYDDNILAHHGIKGMKWGHRKAKTKTLPKKTQRARENAKDMTTKDLEQKIRRYKLESEYNKYTTKDTENTKRIVQTLLVGAAGAALTVASKEMATNGIKALKAMKKAKPAAQYLWDL